MHRLDRQLFALVIIDEIATLARLVGGGTMKHFDNVFRLAALLEAPGVRTIALDADANWKVSDTEPTTAVQDFLRVVARRREVLVVQLDPAHKPPHLNRSVRIHYGSEGGDDTWWAALDGAVSEWKADSRNRFYVTVGTPNFGREVAQFLEKRGVPHELYHGTSNQKKRFEHPQDTATHWLPLGGVIGTTVLSVGVDVPSDVPFNRVFVALDRMGCDFRLQFQATLRPRHVCNPTIEMLMVRCLSPETRQLKVEEGKKNAINKPTWHEALKHEKDQRVFSIRFSELQATAANVRNNVLPATDALLRLMAHARLERSMQMSDPVAVAHRLCEHHGWPIVPLAIGPTQVGAPGQTLTVDDDDRFDKSMDPRAKWKVVLESIIERGVEGFISEMCWGLATMESSRSNRLTAKDQWCVKAFWFLKNIGGLPATCLHGDGDGGDGDGDALADLLHEVLGSGSDKDNKTSVLRLQAHCLTMSPQEMMRQEEAGRRGQQTPGAHPHVELGLGQKMHVVERFGKVLLRDGFRHVLDVYDLEKVQRLPDAVDADLVELANRQKKNQTLDPNQAAMLGELSDIFKQLGCSTRRARCAPPQPPPARGPLGTLQVKSIRSTLTPQEGQRHSAALGHCR